MIILGALRGCFKSRHEASKTQIPAIREQRNVKKLCENLVSLRLGGGNLNFYTIIPILLAAKCHENSVYFMGWRFFAAT
jgi:hypothetical protein